METYTNVATEYIGQNALTNAVRVLMEGLVSLDEAATDVPREAFVGRLPRAVSPSEP